MTRPDVVIGLLTGGRSVRMGRDKATMPVAGQTMARRVAEACRATGFDTVVLGPDSAGTGFDFLADDATDRELPAGPLAGLVTLLRARPDRSVLLVATDQAFLRPETLVALADHEPKASIVVPIDDDGHPQVTCARYGHGVLEAVDAARGSDDEVWRLRSLLDRVETARVAPAVWQTWGEDGRSFRSLDRPVDIVRAVADFEPDCTAGRGPGAQQ